MRTNTPPSHFIVIQEQITCFQTFGNELGPSLLCIGSNKKVILGHVRFPEESEYEQFEWDRIKDIYHESRCTAIAFSPETSLVSVVKSVIFCTAGGDYLLRIFRSDLENSDTVQTLKGHTNYVNDVAWDYNNEFIASVSDDQSCKIWNASNQFESVITFCLSSPGMSVKWHTDEPNKIMVAEKKGIIRIYNVRSQQAVLSVESPKFPLISADWYIMNRLYVVALTAGDVVIWDLRKKCAPSEVVQMHQDSGKIVKFSPGSELVVASIGRPNTTLKVFTSKATVPLLEAELKLFGGMSWHHRLPYIGAAHDRKLSFWKVLIK